MKKVKIFIVIFFSFLFFYQASNGAALLVMNNTSHKLKVTSAVSHPREKTLQPNQQHNFIFDSNQWRSVVTIKNLSNQKTFNVMFERKTGYGSYSYACIGGPDKQDSIVGYAYQYYSPGKALDCHIQLTNKLTTV